MRLNLHARFEIAVAAALLLGSCDGPSLTEKQRDEVEDMADDVVTDSEKVRGLESRVEAIEQRLNI